MLEKDKKFYWIKLKKEFMDGEVIDFLMSQKNGANYIVLYQKLIMNTINTNGELCNKIGEVIIPFDAEKIQRDCKWFDIDTITVAMELYCRLGLIYKNETDIFQIANFEDLVGSETYWANKKRIERKEQGVDKIGQCPTDVQFPLISNIYISNNNNNIEEGVGETKKKKEEKHKYGEYKNVFLTDTELERLKKEIGEKNTNSCIKKLDEAIELKGYKYLNHNLAIRKWVISAVKTEGLWEKVERKFEVVVSEEEKLELKKSIAENKEDYNKFMANKKIRVPSVFKEI